MSLIHLNITVLLRRTSHDKAADYCTWHHTGSLKIAVVVLSWITQRLHSLTTVYTRNVSVNSPLMMNLMLKLRIFPTSFPHTALPVSVFAHAETLQPSHWVMYDRGISTAQLSHSHLSLQITRKPGAFTHTRAHTFRNLKTGVYWTELRTIHVLTQETLGSKTACLNGVWLGHSLQSRHLYFAAFQRANMTTLGCSAGH